MQNGEDSQATLVDPKKSPGKMVNNFERAAKLYINTSIRKGLKNGKSKANVSEFRQLSPSQTKTVDNTSNINNFILYRSKPSKEVNNLVTASSVESMEDEPDVTESIMKQYIKNDHNG